MRAQSRDVVSYTEPQTKEKKNPDVKIEVVEEHEGEGEVVDGPIGDLPVSKFRVSRTCDCLRLQKTGSTEEACSYGR